MTATDLGAAADVIAVVARRLAAAVHAEQESRQSVVPPQRRRALAEELISGEIRAREAGASHAGHRAPDPEASAALAKAVADSLFAMGGLTHYLEMSDVENIICFGHDRVFLRFADGRRERGGHPVAASDEDLIKLVRTVAARAGHEERRFERSAPSLSMQLPDGSRLFATMSLSPRPYLGIRRHRFPKCTLSDLVGMGTLDEGIAAFLAAAVKARLNVIVAGELGGGKTTLLRALAAEIEPGEVVVTIEDAFELGLDSDGDRPVLTLQSREPNSEDQGAYSASQLVRDALRSCADRIIIGEIRGDEVIPALNAMNVGNDGSLSSIHASSSLQVFSRIASCTVQSPERLGLEATNIMVANALHLVVHLAKAPDGTRVVSSIREVVGSDGTMVCSNEIFKPGTDMRAVPATPPTGPRMEKLIAAGWDPSTFRGARR